jgi:hypothetical protein
MKETWGRTLVRGWYCNRDREAASVCVIDCGFGDIRGAATLAADPQREGGVRRVRGPFCVV